MSQLDDPRIQPSSDRPEFPLLERITAAVLVLVLTALGGILLLGSQPDLAGGAAEEVQVVILLALLTAALVLVSVVALLHTRS